MNLREEIFNIVSKDGPFTPYDIIQIAMDSVEKRIDDKLQLYEVCDTQYELGWNRALRRVKELFEDES